MSMCAAALPSISKSWHGAPDSWSGKEAGTGHRSSAGVLLSPLWLHPFPFNRTDHWQPAARCAEE
jgi:hypothetical protein